MSQQPRFLHDQPDPAFHGAALIDEQGREIPITEAMIQEACRRLEQAWHFPRHPDGTPTRQEA